MIFPAVNFLAVLLAAVASMALGFAWYSPYVLGKPWMRLMSLSEKSLKEAQKKMGVLYSYSFIGAIIQAAAITVVLKMAYIPTFEDALLVSGLLWLGFIGVTQFTDAIFSGKKFLPHLLAINTSYQLVSILLMTSIIYLV
ncbi:MAG: hypothetical protein COY81_04740 [Candidatus Pacebacteria bacterium CG_4_10_14_0_8_um_filter_43_12]|nr:MAG: hypothetical protein COU66_01935 [Candidatus Pacebacteria bacterium CG10_big_fil_rev_8_21_14_0_10_44_11]PIY79040.1 MAG: hypothetical protein COY81_04740 [Candidatus Pacebacteria bacterium CG_4_10_14_0_8_um_filter_43_12]